MLKRVIFLALFLSVTDCLFSQVQVADPVQIQDQQGDGSIFVSFVRDIPGDVVKTKNESVVALRSSISAVNDIGSVYSQHFYGCGTVVWDGYVLSVLHIFGQHHPALWRGTDQYPTKATIFGGSDFFFAKVVFIDLTADLILLKIETPNERGAVFNKKPVKIANTTYILDPTSGEPLVLYDKFWAFGFYTDYPGFFHTAILGPYRAITNSLEQNRLLPNLMGVVQGPTQAGFSGTPLLSYNGTMMGLVDATSTLNTWVVTVETINSFLKDAAAHLGLDVDGKPAVPVPPSPLSPEEK
ncbi:MAG: hypothetical protein Q8R34_01445 [bacterium]|nr:hypothetical protein [bacterium]